MVLESLKNKLLDLTKVILRGKVSVGKQVYLKVAYPKPSNKA